MAACAIGSHLALDLFSENGIYLFPKSAGISKWFKTDGGIFRDWGALRINLPRARGSGAGAQIWLNAGICLASLVLIVIILALS